MGEFSMELNDDQLQVLRWVHDFAANVVRPAAHEWDEREETPWPIIEEAARIGMYSFDFRRELFCGSDRAAAPARQRGDGLGLQQASLGYARKGASATPRPGRERQTVRQVEPNRAEPGRTEPDDCGAHCQATGPPGVRGLSAPGRWLPAAPSGPPERRIRLPGPR